VRVCVAMVRFADELCNGGGQSDDAHAFVGRTGDTECCDLRTRSHMLASPI